ncbi:MAG: glutathione transferase GstA [Gammaproteobacteria bacterium]|nr:glutathione transferase GstA [Gammaproteobacteria bacterium]
MKLYYAPGACSLAPHIVMNEMDLPCEREKVDLGTHKTEGGKDFMAINPKGYVPALVLDNGVLLTEVAAIVQYLGDQKATGIVAPAGTITRYQQMEWLSFIATEIHKQLGPFFRPNLPADTREQQMALLKRRFDYLVSHIKGPFIGGNEFSVADAYLFTVLNWTRFLKFDMGAWPALTAYMERVQSRPAVKKTLAEEGLA